MKYTRDKLNLQHVRPRSLVDEANPLGKIFSLPSYSIKIIDIDKVDRHGGQTNVIHFLK